MTEKDSAGTGAAPRLPLIVLMVSAWLVPGLGHLLLGRRQRGVVFALVVGVAFVVGIVLNGELLAPQSGEPLTYLAFIASLGNGVLYFLSQALGLGHGVVTAASYEYGTTFLLTAGMMNLLLVLDTHDLAVGKKVW